MLTGLNPTIMMMYLTNQTLISSMQEPQLSKLIVYHVQMLHYASATNIFLTSSLPVPP